MSLASKSHPPGSSYHVSWKRTFHTGVLHIRTNYVHVHFFCVTLYMYRVLNSTPPIPTPSTDIHCNQNASGQHDSCHTLLVGYLFTHLLNIDCWRHRFGIASSARKIAVWCDFQHLEHSISRIYRQLLYDELLVRLLWCLDECEHTLEITSVRLIPPSRVRWAYVSKFVLILVVYNIYHHPWFMTVVYIVDSEYIMG